MKMRKIKKLLLIMGAITISTNIAFASSVPRPVAADSHVKMVAYDANNVVQLKGRYGYQTQITFAPNESINSVSIGDSLAWLASPANNNLFIKPVTESTTNMTVLTNARSYNFQLDSSDLKARPTYKLQFTYEEGGHDQLGNSHSIASFDPKQLNWQYSFTGDKTLAPLQAFDNGQFTYFKFKQPGTVRLPAVFIVGKGSKETLVNYHMEGDYLVVNSTAEQFTLRHGDYVTSVYNDAEIEKGESHGTK